MSGILLLMSSSVLIYVTSEINVNIGGVINMGQKKEEYNI